MQRPFDLAARQIHDDRQTCAWMPALYEQKRQRLRASPHAFLRGTPRLFFHVLAEDPWLAEGPAGEGTVVGDMHLENVGAYRTDEDRVVFDLNDFDEAQPGPWRIDVLRAATSVVLAIHAFETSHELAVDAALALLRGHRDALFDGLGGEPEALLPPAMKRLLESVRGRSKQDLLDARAPRQAGARRFVRGERYVDLPPALAAQVPALLAEYRRVLGPRAPAHAAEWEIEDAAQRIAGNGSLGTVRVALIVRESSGNERIVELKQARPSVVEALVGRADPRPPARRVVEGAQALVAAPPRMLAALERVPGDLSLTGRQLFPQEDKLLLREVRSARLSEVAGAVGRILGAAHARAATKAVFRWSEHDLDEILVRAVALTGIFEATHLAHLRLTD